VLAVHPGWFSSDVGGEAVPLKPAQAAERVADLLMNSFDPAGPVYLTSDSAVMDW